LIAPAGFADDAREIITFDDKFAKRAKVKRLK